MKTKILLHLSIILLLIQWNCIFAKSNLEQNQGIQNHQEGVSFPYAGYQAALSDYRMITTLDIYCAQNPGDYICKGYGKPVNQQSGGARPPADPSSQPSQESRPAYVLPKPFDPEQDVIYPGMSNKKGASLAVPPWGAYEKAINDTWQEWVDRERTQKFLDTLTEAQIRWWAQEVRKIMREELSFPEAMSDEAFEVERYLKSKIPWGYDSKWNYVPNQEAANKAQAEIEARNSESLQYPWLPQELSENSWDEPSDYDDTLSRLTPEQLDTLKQAGYKFPSAQSTEVAEIAPLDQGLTEPLPPLSEEHPVQAVPQPQFEPQQDATTNTYYEPTWTTDYQEVPEPAPVRRPQIPAETAWVVETPAVPEPFPAPIPQTTQNYFQPFWEFETTPPAEEFEQLSTMPEIEAYYPAPEDWDYWQSDIKQATISSKNTGYHTENKSIFSRFWDWITGIFSY